MHKFIFHLVHAHKPKFGLLLFTSFMLFQKGQNNKINYLHQVSYIRVKIYIYISRFTYTYQDFYTYIMSRLHYTHQDLYVHIKIYIYRSRFIHTYQDLYVHIKISYTHQDLYIYIKIPIYIEIMTGIHEEHLTGLPGYPAPNQNVGFDTAFRELF